MTRLLIISLAVVFAGCASTSQPSSTVRVQQMHVRTMSASDRAAMDATKAEMAQALAQFNSAPATPATGVN